ncbi:Uu.00g041950.m01.CDS01 [Anthostomella pinea]|uniref:ferric-chelate reductase (NADPH) n=1 Tax=Anthostomella pinea TaxID=933095 RepID=A0AAI8VB58_9PEZI|nr:Uu.00g041950.m01.CDS01 [Anthostomella pinea]
MDMTDMPAGGVPWLDQPVEMHSSRETTCSMTPEQCAYKMRHWVFWYEADHVYALGTVYFFIATIALYFISFWTLRLAPRWLQKNAVWQKTVGAVRYMVYRHYESRLLRWYTPSLGVIALIGIGAVFFLAMTLGPQPYYWPNTPELSYGNSPPIATRAGWMALACLPFLIILPTKANMIAFLTGVSHERLIIFHNWVGWAMFALALVHTFPFIVYHEWKGDMEMSWRTDVYYWTGVIALVAQAYLQFMSISWIRNRFYEFFKVTHYIAALVFVVFFFLHCDFTLTSCDYFIAAGVVYALHFLYHQIRTYFEYGIKHRATFNMVSDQALKITILTNATWYPGQHVFLRFLTLGVHAFTAHPFTICSVPSRDSGKSKLVCYVQPRGGTTGRLASAAAKWPGHSVPVLLDGPYGGIRGRPLHSYDHTVIIACGAGAPFALGLIMNRLLVLAYQARSSAEKPTARMEVILSSRDAHIAEWYTDALADFLHENDMPVGLDGLDGVEIILHYTGRSEKQPSEKDSSEKEPSEKVEQDPHNSIPIPVVYSRCVIRDIIERATSKSGSSVAIVACGPAAVLKDSNDVAALAQKRILQSSSGAREVYLHTELFSW